MEDNDSHYFILYSHNDICIKTNGEKLVHNTEHKNKEAGYLSMGAKFIEKHNINPIGIIMFHIHRYYNLVIDYLATNDKFRQIGVARYLIYLDQLVSKK